MPRSRDGASASRVTAIFDLPRGALVDLALGALAVGETLLIRTLPGGRALSHEPLYDGSRQRGAARHLVLRRPPASVITVTMTLLPTARPARNAWNYGSVLAPAGARTIRRACFWSSGRTSNVLSVFATKAPKRVSSACAPCASVPSVIPQVAAGPP